MEQRKIMALGKSSLVISIPKPWLRMNDLERGDRVSLQIQPDGTLTVYPTSEIREKRKEIHLCIQAEESEESIIRRIIGSYLDGYTAMKLTSTKIFSPEQQRAIRGIVGTLYMMIMKSEASSVVLQTLIDESKASVSSSVERMHIITYSMCRDILNSMRNLDQSLARSVVSLEDDVDQLMFFLLRLIRSAAIDPSLGNQLGLDPLDCLDYQTLVHRIERIADHATIIAQSVIALAQSGMEIPKNILEALTKSAEIAFTSYDQAVQGYLSKDIEPTNQIIDRQREIDDLYQGITPLPLFGMPGDASMLSNVINIRESINKISHHTADIAELTIDRAYKSESLK
ncbi:MAG: AbrB/MazE/SpoVT family DNA-binding domain-containing protein [Candidatus Bathyarchaeota archaeon]|nr:MAG: AbrB/MazE/SpoVT family DNA-binding domain-containing protein [Candidatus Bathyarchaeota archaeon]